MQTSESIADLAAALAKAQAEYEPIGKDKKVKTAQYSYTYADLATVMEAIRPALNKHGLAIIQAVATSGATVQITTRLVHASGQWVETTMTLTAEGAAVQKLGSAITYGRRYSFLGIAGAAPTDEDDDGQAAMQTGAQALAQVRARQAKAVAEEPEKVAAEPFPREEAGNAGDAMRQVIGKLRTETGRKPTATSRKADAFAYISGKVGKEKLREKVEAILGRTFPADFADEMLITLAELDKLESWVADAEAAAQEEHDTRNS